jgi:hypothetical protein
MRLCGTGIPVQHRVSISYQPELRAHVINHAVLASSIGVVEPANLSLTSQPPPRLCTHALHAAIELGSAPDGLAPYAASRCNAQSLNVPLREDLLIGLFTMRTPQSFLSKSSTASYNCAYSLASFSANCSALISCSGKAVGELVSELG